MGDDERRSCSAYITLTSPSGQLKLVPPNPIYDDDVARLRSHPETRRYLPCLPPLFTLGDVRARRESRAQQDSIMDLYVLLYDGGLGSPPKFIGMTGLFNIDRPNDSCSIGILIHPDYFRGGFATQVLYTLMAYAFEDYNQHMHRIVFETGADNIQMRGWLENVVGAQMEFRWREAWKATPGQWIDAVGYSILEHEWRGSVKDKLEARLNRLINKVHT